MNNLSVLTFVVCLSSVLSVRVCDGTKNVEWRGDPADCSVFYMCFGTLQHKYNCAKNMVYNEEVRTCVRKGSEQDQCKLTIISANYL